MIKNKRGVMGIVFFFLLLLTILIVGFGMAMVLSIVTHVSEEITPIMTDLGMVDNFNMSEAGEYTFGTLDSVITALPWVVAFSYVAMLLFSIIFVVSWNYNPNPVYIGIYLMFVILLILGSIVMSNIYQDIYTGTDVVALGLQDQYMLSFLILHSPWIMTLIAFIVGIYIFAGKQTEMQGGFDI